MGIKEWFANLKSDGKKIVNTPTTTTSKKERKPKIELSAKELATQKGEPWVSVLAVDLDMDNIGNGAFNLDWNEIFVARLVKSGYKGKDDITIVDQWFQDVCRNVLQETYEQQQADPTNRNK